MSETVEQRLEYLRGELRAERISYGELHELRGLAEHIRPDDPELLEAAGVPEEEYNRRLDEYEREQELRIRLARIETRWAAPCPPEEDETT